MSTSKAKMHSWHSKLSLICICTSDYYCIPNSNNCCLNYLYILPDCYDSVTSFVLLFIYVNMCSCELSDSIDITASPSDNP